MDASEGRNPADENRAVAALAPPYGRSRKRFNPRQMARHREGMVPGDAYAALDLGTNNCRLLIAAAKPGGYDVVDAFSRIVRLGEGLGLSGELSQPAMDRTLDALRVCANKLVWHGIVKQRLIATEACRLAGNGAAFVTRVERETGLKLEIINRETEANLAALGAAPLIDADADDAVIFDIGGGSTEVMWMERHPLQGFALKAWTSLPAGVVTLSERVGGGTSVSPAKFEEMRADVRLLLQPFVQSIAARTGGRTVPSHLLGTSGTVTTIAGVHLGLRHYDRSRVDGCWMTSAAVEEVTGRLLAMSYQQRIENGCIGRERADLVLAGCAILEEVREAFPAQRIRVADRGLREGMLAELMQVATT